MSTIIVVRLQPIRSMVQFVPQSVPTQSVPTIVICQQSQIMSVAVLPGTAARSNITVQAPGGRTIQVQVYKYHWVTCTSQHFQVQYIL